MYSRPIRFESEEQSIHCKEKQVQIQLDFPEFPLVWSGHQAKVLLPAYAPTGLRLSLASRNSPEPKLRLPQPGFGFWHSVCPDIPNPPPTPARNSKDLNILSSQNYRCRGDILNYRDYNISYRLLRDTSRYSFLPLENYFLNFFSSKSNISFQIINNTV